jgi:Fe-S-cluster containining protein
MGEKGREPGFVCKQCGHCCLNMSGGYCHSVGIGQIRKWRKRKRRDILKWVCAIGAGIYDVWISPVTGEDVDRCPWLRKMPNQNKYRCRIQEDKTDVCRDFPHSRKQAEDAGCKGYSHLDAA